MSRQEEKIEKTKIGQFLQDKLPEVAAKFTGVLPDKGVLGILKRVVDGSPELTAAEKLEFEKLAMEQEISAQEQVTRRWEADAKSDIKLAKYIRPVTLIVLTVFFMSLTVWDGMDVSFMPPENYINLLEVLMLTVFGAYFAGRTIEKVKR
ncbi:MAG: hypothetical protein Unbinned4409contig1001_40 [Prokaryotic dsDNA virus sp.]|nr:MAG: hypothetical protein Unbinned4409contig1001_40 [Prokaryotic dsDNA virus sp.]|tara:strand:- start:10305 stop:10754 length:450 start_codon:yes stop_codon:yes gene_type:complete